jgi:ribosomal-protein-alanine N-acetyltransferase
VSLDDPASTILRKAMPGDVDAIIEIERVSFVHAGERFGESRVRYLIGSARAMVSVAEVHGRAAGWIAGFVWKRGKEPWGRIYAVAVHPDARGRGLAGQLMRSMIEALIQGGSRKIFLEVRPDNTTAIRLYERFGFVCCRVLPNYYGQGVPAQRMVRMI